jgi:hypothetical protein
VRFVNSSKDRKGGLTLLGSTFATFVVGAIWWGWLRTTIHYLSIACGSFVANNSRWPFLKKIWLLTFKFPHVNFDRKYIEVYPSLQHKSYKLELCKLHVRYYL